MKNFIDILYGVDKVRKDKNIFQTFTTSSEKNDYLLKKGIISPEEHFKREYPELHIGRPVSELEAEPF